MYKKIISLTAAAIFLVSVPCTVRAASDRLSRATTEERMLAGKPFEQDFIVTAYYSPKPRQCGYVMGGLDADIQLNGRGTNGADGTEVYAGMVAAPPTYPFGTRLKIPGIGTVTVHDRGSAIQESTKVHHIDVWVGTGEEGLARALQFGVKYIRGVVYPPESLRPSESIDLATLESPTVVLKPYLTDHATLSDCEAMYAFGDRLEETMLEAEKKYTFLIPKTRKIEVADDLRFFSMDSGA